MAKKKNKNLTQGDEYELEQFFQGEQKANQKPVLSNIKISIVPKTENQQSLVDSIKKNPFTLCVGKPGTGKTLLTCAEALMLLQNKESKIKKIILCKSVVPVSLYEDIGFIKGELSMKMQPIIESYMDAFQKLIGRSETEKLIKYGYIEILPISFLRGRSLSGFLIVDEAENLTMHSIHTIMTRMETNGSGSGGKVVLLGDLKQQDLKGESAYRRVIEKFENIKDFGVVKLNQDCDIQRSPLISLIEKIFSEIDVENAALSKNKKK